MLNKSCTVRLSESVIPPKNKLNIIKRELTSYLILRPNGDVLATCFLVFVIRKSSAGSHYQLRWPFQSSDVIGLGYGRPFYIEFISLGSGKQALSSRIPCTAY